MRVKGTVLTVLVVDLATAGVSTGIRCGLRPTEEPRDKAGFSRDRQSANVDYRRNLERAQFYCSTRSTEDDILIPDSIHYARGINNNDSRYHRRKQGSRPRARKMADRAKNLVSEATERTWTAAQQVCHSQLGLWGGPEG